MQFSDTQVPLAGALANFYGVGVERLEDCQNFESKSIFLTRRCPRRLIKFLRGGSGKARGLPKFSELNVCNFLTRRCPRGSACQIFAGWVEGRGIAKKIGNNMYANFDTQVPPR